LPLAQELTPLFLKSLGRKGAGWSGRMGPLAMGRKLGITAASEWLARLGQVDMSFPFGQMLPALGGVG
jgi:hypothetical protein